jgi:hypothetical protein
MRHLCIIGCYTPWVTMWGIQCVEDTSSMTKAKEWHHRSCGFDLIKCSAEFWATYLWDKNEMSLELRDVVLENSCARYKACYKSIWNSQDVHMCGSIEIHVVKFIGHCAAGKWDMWWGRGLWVVCFTHLTKPAQLESIFISNSHLI